MVPDPPETLMPIALCDSFLPWTCILPDVPKPRVSPKPWKLKIPSDGTVFVTPDGLVAY
jgi:hypothetical protein